MNEIITSLVVLSVSAVSFIAYRHPEIYEKVLFKKLLITAVAIYVAITIWRISSDAAFITLLPFVDKDKIDLANKALEEKQLPFGITSLVFLGIQAYLFVLSYMADHFKKEKEVSPKRNT